MLNLGITTDIAFCTSLCACEIQDKAFSSERRKKWWWDTAFNQNAFNVCWVKERGTSFSLVNRLEDAEKSGLKFHLDMLGTVILSISSIKYKLCPKQKVCQMFALTKVKCKFWLLRNSSNPSKGMDFPQIISATYNTNSLITPCFVSVCIVLINVSHN